MEYRLTEAEETIDAVLQGVIDDTQQWAAQAADARESSSVLHQHQGPLSVPELQPAGSADQPLERLFGHPQLGAPGAATAPDALSQISPVLSAINPLFLPAQASRPQSAQLQQTLSSMSQQLSALEDSMQQPPDESVVGTPARPLSAQSADTRATANLSQQQGALSTGCLCASCSVLVGPVITRT